MRYGGDEISGGYDESQIVVVPVPYDETSTWMRGADRGPEAIMYASEYMDFYDTEVGGDIRGKGIFTTDPVMEKTSPELMVTTVGNICTELYSGGKFPVVVGGNHSVSIGAMRAAAACFDDLTILQFDAHSDLRERYEGSPLNHACVMARAREMTPIVQAGIRSMSPEESVAADFERIIFAHEIWRDDGWQERLISLLSPKVYITIDLDVLDPSEMPSTGTPEPGGLRYRELTGIMRRVVESTEVVGFDLVELCPGEGNRAPDFLAARLIYQILSYRFL